MPLSFALWLFFVSLAASAAGGMLGMASGVFIVPILTMFGGVDVRVAVAASLVSVIACSCASAPAFLESGLTNVRLALVLETATTLGALTGVVLSGLVPARVLFFLFAVILAVSAQQMLARRREAPSIAAPTAQDEATWATKLGLHASHPDPNGGAAIAYSVRRLPIGMALMYSAGLVSALLGIGSGVLKIPAMDTALKLPIKVSSATSNFMIGVTAAASAGAYFVRGDVAPEVAGLVALGSVVGAVVGAKILLRISNDRVRVFFVVILALLALQMLAAAFGVHAAKAGAR